MQIYEELVARGLIAQVTNEEEIREMGITARPCSTSALTAPPTLSMWATLWLCA